MVAKRSHTQDLKETTEISWTHNGERGFEERDTHKAYREQGRLVKDSKLTDEFMRMGGGTVSECSSK